MKIFKNKFFLFILTLLVIIGGFFYFRYQVYHSHGKNKESTAFKITKGENNTTVSGRLKEEGLISGKVYFYYYMRSQNLLGKILPGDYEFSGRMTIPEIAQMITRERENYIKITFPEGWGSVKMADRLKENNLNGDEFLKLVKEPEKFKERYGFLNDPEIKSLEGYLFPDTYFFVPGSSAEKIIWKMLDNFQDKLDEKIISDIKIQNKSLNEIMTMASIIEMEVRSAEDRGVVSGIFWNRISIGQPLQSCATLAYILGVNKKQYSYEDTRTDSPYNTYINKNLPPGPISNPGLASIKAAVYPQKTAYMFFLSDPETGKTYFAKTAEEHNLNKVNHGL
ncbi:MAG TPA: endolytic transglycosylase MltG [Candidatus Moranbacteria bacterium]|nr:endolytic transglycosylase MltG [Candidatus Moranbacteria bacterium]